MIWRARAANSDPTVATRNLYLGADLEPTISAHLVGVDPFTTLAGFQEFPSDHAGVVATLRVP